VSVWRHLLAGGLSKKNQRLEQGSVILSEHRDIRGGWRRFPFYYTLLALMEMKGKTVDREIKYAAPKLERLLKRREKGTQVDARRRKVAEGILARI